MSTFFTFRTFRRARTWIGNCFPGSSRWRPGRARSETSSCRCLPNAEGRERVFGSAALEADHLRGLDQPPTWNGYYFYRHGERRTENCDRCRKYGRRAGSLPLCKIREHGPEVLFSIFTPGTHLLPHRGVTNIRVVAHLPLIVPETARLSWAASSIVGKRARS